MPPITLLHMTRRGRELSATSSSVVIWIMPSASRTALLRADTSDDFPGLQFRERPAFADADDVARPEFPVLIVRVVFLRASHCLPHHRMGETAFNLHDHGLGVLVAHHDALENAFGHVLNPLPLPLRLARLLAHNGLDARDLAPDRAYAARVLELSVRALEPQVELFLFEFGERIRELVRRL